MYNRLLPISLVVLGLAACGEDAVHPYVDGTAAVGSSGSGSGSSSSGGAGGSASLLPEPDPKFIPAAAGACPDFSTGKNTFAPAGIPARDALVWASTDADAKDGPLVFFWHGAGGDPSEAPYALGDKAMAEIQAMGGVVVAPYHDPKSSQLPWFLCLGGSTDDDLLVADEILACAIAKKGVDMRHIHSVGFSAGAMHTEQLTARRSGYIASEVVYSGAQLGEPPIQDETNHYPAMLFYGGPSDQVIISFDTNTHAYHDWMTMNGHFSFLCNHNMGHTVPADGRDSAWQFLQDHPFGVSPEPYEKALPAGFPSYCSL